MPVGLATACGATCPGHLTCGPSAAFLAGRTGYSWELSKAIARVTTDGDACKLPFQVDGQWYDDCTLSTPGGELGGDSNYTSLPPAGVEWCSLTTVFGGRWGQCVPTAPLLPGLPSHASVAAALRAASGPSAKSSFFRISCYVRYDVTANKQSAGYPTSIAGNWSGLSFDRGHS
eukprot:Opistho-2@84454